ncbi:Gfo/Idh/MocA family oxidoreductase [Pelagibacterales bacterium SAG-MED01]|nr:Gfo/Idh/MocA family oxidoreductase [Pelagibacterales bacterium SAG-MED01]
MKKNFNIGVIGLGVGERHIESYFKFGCKVKKIFDFDKKKMLLIKKKYPSIEICSSENDIFNDIEINIISIASYDNYHFNQILKGIKNEKNIFVEKPMVLKEAHLSKVFNLLKKNKNIHLYSNFILSESPVFINLKKSILNNDFGKIYSVEADYNYGRLKKITHGWRGKIPYYSVTLGGGIHMVDLISWMVESHIVEVKSYGNKFCTNKSAFKYNDCTVSLLKFANGMIAKISSNFGCVYPHFHKLAIYGTKKTFENDIENIRIFKSKSKNIVKKTKNNYKNYYKGNAIKFFLESIGKQSLRKKLIERVFYSIKVCFAIERSIKNNKTVKINYLK